jgi:hypothetical protein
MAQRNLVKRRQDAVRSRMTYEEHLDEVTTLIAEEYGMSDEAAIRMVMRAQADAFFSGHDDDPSICTLERAHQDAKIVFRKYN